MPFLRYAMIVVSMPRCFVLYCPLGGSRAITFDMDCVVVMIVVYLRLARLKALLVDTIATATSVVLGMVSSGVKCALGRTSGLWILLLMIFIL